MVVGTDSSHEKETAWIDHVLDTFYLPFRIEGAIGLALRMLYATPVLFALAYVESGSYWACLLTPTMGLSYYITGLLFNGKGWHYGEYLSGGILGILTYWSVM